jgi:hypothetical protein
LNRKRCMQGIPAVERRTVTPEVAGSSPVAPAKRMPCKAEGFRIGAHVATGDRTPHRRHYAAHARPADRGDGPPSRARGAHTHGRSPSRWRPSIAPARRSRRPLPKPRSRTCGARGRAAPLHARRVERRVPLARAPIVEVKMPAERSGEQQRRAEPRRNRVEREHRPSRQQHATAVGLRIRRQHAVAVAPLHRDRRAGAVDVAPFDRGPLVRA